MKTFRFLDFPVYQLSRDFYQFTVMLTRTFPKFHWELENQMRRAALSICLNIAEGSVKYSDKDFKRFIENALGSVNESMACLDIALKTMLISDKLYGDGYTQAESIARQLGGLSKKLRSSH